MFMKLFRNIMKCAIYCFSILLFHCCVSVTTTTVTVTPSTTSLNQNRMGKGELLGTIPNSSDITKIFKDNQSGRRNTPKFVIPEGYKKDNRPVLTNDPIFVWFDIHVVAINPIKAADMDFRWIDARLNFSDDWFDNERDFFILPLDYTKKIWHPDPYIVNAKSTDVGQLTQKLISVYIFKNHTVHYISNIYATVACAMNYKYYPYDHQVCPMYIESFSYDETQVKYLWAEEDDAFTINAKLRMLQFQVTRPLHFHETSVPRYLEPKNFSQLIACFRFDRLLGNHIIQTFAPCSLIVCLSWFSFWLELNALSARMSLVVTSILTLVTQFVGLKADFPPVAYAVDIWMAGCLICVFASLGEYVLVKVLYSVTEDVKFQYYERKRFGEEVDRRESGTHNHANGEAAVGQNEYDFHTISYRQRNKSARLSRPAGSYAVDNKECCRQNSINLDEPVYLEKVAFGKLRIPPQWAHEKTGRVVYLWRKIDNFSKWFFPLTFCIFCALYWILLYLHYKSSQVQPYSRQINLHRSACIE